MGTNMERRAFFIGAQLLGLAAGASTTSAETAVDQTANEGILCPIKLPRRWHVSARQFAPILIPALSRTLLSFLPDHLYEGEKTLLPTIERGALISELNC